VGRKAIDPIERFHSKYIINEETGCWEWQDRLTTYGYGVLQIKGKTIKAHRFSYETFVAPLVEGLVIAHNCNNRKCVNFNHLRQDTYHSNSIDMVNTKKQSSQILSVEEVIAIKKALINPYCGIQRELADLYIVNERTISSINKGYSWSHIVI